ncbi:phosphoenolpyruvate synthase [Halospina denitrificans]|uniref:Phosphoenolpyruvate synthase n=1 Tax=Halospina denitrificans TaxID=332522 RepID=A0A4R7JVJ1_9GAMM|nr:phosphoenolpyruvate synthase [Halospina denitrificans]TDT41443.1 phosphoenolpyruvate synthase [Halospina denitrificans]
MDNQDSVRPLEQIDYRDVALVGGKNASLGEMTSALRAAGVRVPEGFATTANAYWGFLEANGLVGRITDQLQAFERGDQGLASTGRQIRALFNDTDFPPELARAIKDSYREMAERLGQDEPDVAVRSSATAEDLPEASFAGQQETFLNIRGEEALLDACRRCFASLFTDRAITYRNNNGFDHMKVALSVGVQRMVRSDLAGSGVMFSIDTETGFPRAVLINANWGLGETVVQGSVDPDEYMVFKPLLDTPGTRPIIEKRAGAKGRKLVYSDQGSEVTRLVDTSREEQLKCVLTDDEILQLARWAVAIEDHYGQAMDMEWAKDGTDGSLYIVQARPETVQSQRGGGELKRYRLNESGTCLVQGLSIGDAVAAGPVCKLASPDEIEDFVEDGVLVTGMTDPDWIPIMKRAAAIVTDHGGRTSHAAIVSRELGLPAIVGTGSGTQVLKDGQQVTVSCAEGDEGFVYEGELDFSAETLSLDDIPDTRTRVMLNLANPAAAQRWWRLPAQGVGLARMEFIINNTIKIHPMALVRWPDIDDPDTRERIGELTRGYDDKPEYFVDQLARSLGRLAAVFYPEPAIVRMSDFKTNEYARLIGGAAFEPEEENPMLGWRGASRYYDADYREGFALECRAIRKVREEMGFRNVVVMIPFCRTPEEADKVLAEMAGNGLERGVNDLEVYVMAEVPSNVIEAEAFASRFDGFSIGSNDLTQLVLGVDRDSDRLSGLFDERRPAVTRMISQLISTAHEQGCKTGLCGQAPSDHPDFARFLVGAGIGSISVNPDSFIAVKLHVAEAESGEPANPRD